MDLRARAGRVGPIRASVEFSAPDLAEQLRRSGLLGGDVAVALACTAPASGRRAWCCGTRSGRPVDDGTPFYAASVTKQLVGVLVAQQVLAGRLDVETSVRALLPGLPPWTAPVRVRHLLHHTSGLPGTARVVAAAGHRQERELTNASVLSALGHLPGPDRPPGEVFAYSNVGYVVLAEVLAAVTGTPLPVLARRLVLDPLGLAGWLGAPPARTPAERQPPATLGDGGWWTGAADLLTWLEALDGGRLGPEVSALVQTPGRLDDGSPLTYGWGVTVRADGGRTTLTHGGGWPGWTAKTVRSPGTGAAVALLTTSDDTDAVSRAAVALQAQLVGGPSSQSSSRPSSSRRPSAS